MTSIANITITFPSQYGNVSTFTCVSLIINDVNVNSYSCVRSGNKVTFRNILTVDTAVKDAIVVIGNIKNPTPGGSVGAFGGTIGTDVSITNSDSYVYLTANAFSSCSATYNNAYGNRSSELII